MPNNIILRLKSKGVVGVLSAIYHRVIPRRAECVRLCKKLLSNKSGLEIGGPSSVFNKKNLLQVYPIVNQLDNCNFAGTTTWEGTIVEGMTFQFNKNHSPGIQYLSEATDLYKIPSAKYDFILSSHVIEHIANPLQALSEWIRVLKDDGILLLLIPHKDGTFDHRRPATTISHLIEDLDHGTKEDDLTHLPEILKLHDLDKDPEAGTLEDFRKRSENNFQNRCLHHHVFDTELVVQMLNHKNLQVLAVETILPHIIVIAKKDINSA